MQQWDYLSLFLESNIAPYRKELQERFPGEHPSQYSPLALIPQLEEFGHKGWELITCHPYSVGDNSDVLTHRTSAANNSTWTNLYFCVFKRPKEPATPSPT
jgi:hypothetical protein